MKFVSGVPDNLDDESFKEGHANVLIIFDDLMEQITAREDVTNLFNKGSHHRGISVIRVVQDLFPTTSKWGVQQRINCDYFVFFNTNTNKAQISRLGSQMLPMSKVALLHLYCHIMAGPPPLLKAHRCTTVPTWRLVSYAVTSADPLSNNAERTPAISATTNGVVMSTSTDDD